VTWRHPLGLGLGSLPLMYFGTQAMYESERWHAVELLAVGLGGSLLIVASYLLSDPGDGP
jgi:hypothetical protein